MPSIVMDVCWGEKLSLVDRPAANEAYNGFDLKNWVKKMQSAPNEFFCLKMQTFTHCGQMPVDNEQIKLQVT